MTKGAAVVTEESLARDIVERMTVVPEPVVTEKREVVKFEFDAPFQTRIATMIMRDTGFNEKTEGLIKPEYFENLAEAAMVNLGLRYFAKYKRTPDMVVLTSLIKEDIASKIIRKDMIVDVKKFIRESKTANIGDRDYVVDKVADFAKHQAVTNAILDSVDLLEKGNFDKISEIVKKALEIGANDSLAAYDYWAEIESRTAIRKELAAGTMTRRGITTGIRKLDQYLYHHGWGRKELTILMGGPKVGKSTALGNFAKNASLAGYNVCVFTLEVSNEIISERLEASIADIAIKSLGEHIMETDSKIKLAGKKAGKMMIHEHPSGSLSSNDIRRIIGKHKSDGLTFDLIVVDYADLMAPDYRTDNAIDNSKQCYIGLRAIASEEDVAVLSATQTNREGAKSSVATMDHVAEDFNKIRIADLTISINKSDEEKKRNEARLYFVASRNQEGGFTLRIQQDMEKMQFIKKILGRE